MSTNGVEQGEARRTRCLLYVPRGCEAPIDLASSLAGRHVEAREVCSAPAVMAELAKADYAALIVVHPKLCRQIEALQRAIRRYHGSVAIWQYDGSAAGRLSRLAETEAQTARPDEQRIGEKMKSAKTRAPEFDSLGRPIEDDDEDEMLRDERAKERDADVDDTDDQPLVSEEELEMLLGEEPYRPARNEHA